MKIVAMKNIVATTSKWPLLHVFVSFCRYYYSDVFRLVTVCLESVFNTTVENARGIDAGEFWFFPIMYICY